MDLFLQIIKKSQELFWQKYGGAFYVLLWSVNHDDENDYNYILSGLQKNNMDVITTKEIFQKDDLEGYVIDLHGHPNSKANNKIADYLLTKIKDAS